MQSIPPKDPSNQPVPADDRPVTSLPIRLWLTIAGIALLAGGAMFFSGLLNDKGGKARPSHNPANDGLPGHQGGILELADGSSITLDSLPDGVIATQGDAVIAKTGDLLTYRLEADSLSLKVASSQPPVTNTLKTPIGRVFRVTLPDGSKVWLNAASSISFPAVFTGGQREVILTGEACFEVFRDETRPFQVQVAQSPIFVSGAQFNINAYNDEPSIKITAIAGDAQVRSGSKSTTIKSGMQGRTDSVTGLTTLFSVDPTRSINWRKGLFDLRENDIPSIMRQLSRWYNVKVNYSGNIPAITFAGEIRKDSSISFVLQRLGKGGLHYKLEDTTITITP